MCSHGVPPRPPGSAWVRGRRGGPEVFRPTVMVDRPAPRPYRLAHPCPVVRTLAQESVGDALESVDHDRAPAQVLERVLVHEGPERTAHLAVDEPVRTFQLLDA